LPAALSRLAQTASNSEATMRKFYLTLAGILLFSILPAAVFAHHSFSNYDMKTDTTLTGVVTRLEWTNPHTYLYVNVTDAAGKTQEWSVEFAAIGHLMRMGITKDTFKPGDQVTAVGHPARNALNAITFSSITTADGKNFGSAPAKPATQGAQQ
jgi:hypothetical protein